MEPTRRSVAGRPTTAGSVPRDRRCWSARPRGIGLLLVHAGLRRRPPRLDAALARLDHAPAPQHAQPVQPVHRAVALVAPATGPPCAGGRPRRDRSQHPPARRTHRAGDRGVGRRARRGGGGSRSSPASTSPVPSAALAVVVGGACGPLVADAEVRGLARVSAVPSSCTRCRASSTSPRSCSPAARARSRPCTPPRASATAGRTGGCDRPWSTAG